VCRFPHGGASLAPGPRHWVVSAVLARWTVQQVVASAPDDRVVRAARSLARPGPWSELGSTDALVWGRCQGSGSTPYQVTVDLTEPAFRCSCPSRKQPCKHAVALLLLWVEGSGSVADVAEVPADLAAGPDSAFGPRGPARRPGAPADQRREIVDPEAQARRRAQRLALMDAGMDDFERWLQDLVRQGLAAARQQPYAFWDGAAARLVDAQLPGLAERVRDMAGELHQRGRVGPGVRATQAAPGVRATQAAPGVRATQAGPGGGHDWADHLTAEAGRWYLAVRAWRRRDHLDAAAAGDLRVVLGWPMSSEEVLAGARDPSGPGGGEIVRDRWLVAGVHRTDDGRLQAQRTWLRGFTTGRWALVLDFAAAGASLRVAQVTGSIVDAELALYPGSEPRRALFATDPRVEGQADGLAGGTGVAGALDRAADALAANPWVPRVPVVLDPLALAFAAETVVAVEPGPPFGPRGPGPAFGPCRPGPAFGPRRPGPAFGPRRPVVAVVGLAEDQDPWPALAVTGGHPTAVFGEWEPGLRGLNAQSGLRGPNAQSGVRGLNAGTGTLRLLTVAVDDTLVPV
jgi:hypothetical protein